MRTISIHLNSQSVSLGYIFMLSSRLSLLPNYSFARRFPIKFLYAVFISPIRTTCSAHSSPLDYIQTHDQTNISALRATKSYDLFGKWLLTLHTNSIKVFRNANNPELFEMYFCIVWPLGVAGTIILQLILQKQCVKV
jgi:hypothetical protein